MVSAARILGFVNRGWALHWGHGVWDVHLYGLYMHEVYTDCYRCAGTPHAENVLGNIALQTPAFPSLFEVGGFFHGLLLMEARHAVLWHAYTQR